MNKLLLATRNLHKQKEIQALLSGKDIEVITLRDVAPLPEIIEDGVTFAANALKKAEVTAKLTDYWCLADDSGLEVDYLNGRPGVYSARYAGEPSDDAANNRKLLTELTGVPDAERTAQFVCVLALVSPAKNWLLEGVCRGRIARKAEGDNGFGYDPLFMPEGYELTFAQLSPETKNRISHRAKALNQLAELLAKQN